MKAYRRNHQPPNAAGISEMIAVSGPCGAGCPATAPHRDCPLSQRGRSLLARASSSTATSVNWIEDHWKLLRMTIPCQYRSDIGLASVGVHDDTNNCSLLRKSSGYPVLLSIGQSCLASRSAITDEVRMSKLCALRGGRLITRKNLKLPLLRWKGKKLK